MSSPRHRLPGAALFVLAAACASCARRPQPGTVGPAHELPLTHAPQPTSAAITAGDLMTRDYIIADDSMQGRRVGHRGNYLATAYIADQFRRFGLEPAGENGTFFQTIPLRILTFDTTSTLTVAGAPLVLERDWFPTGPITAILPAFSLSASDVPVVYGGRAGDSATLSPEQAAGKLVILAPPLDAAGRPSGQYMLRGGLERYPGARAVAIASLDLALPALLHALRQPRTYVSAADTVPSGPLGILLSDGAARRMFGAPLDSLSAGATGGTASARIDFRLSPPEAPARNVVAILRGSDPAVRGEYVAIGAHNDHIGMQEPPVDHDSVIAYNRVMRPEGAQNPVGTPTAAQDSAIRAELARLRAVHRPRRDSVFNGADDDGSGTVALLEIAQNLAAAPTRPRRSILFVSHTGEEAGLVGSRWFTDHPTMPRDSVVAQLNMDMVGRGTWGRGFRSPVQIIGAGRLSTELRTIVDSVAAADSVPLNYEFDAPHHPLRRYCRSDHFMYARYGIPISYFSRGYHIAYHQVIDEPQYLDYEGLAQVARLVRDVALAVANRDHRIVVDKPKPASPEAPCVQ